MGKKKSNGGGGEIKTTTDDNGSGGGGVEGKKDGSSLTVVLKLDMHCEGCATKIKKSVRSFHGVEVVKGGDGDLTKLTVIGKVDPAELREAVEKAAKEKVELISPAAPPTSNKENNNSNGGGGGGRSNKQGERKGEEKVKEPPVRTAVMKLNLHCHGCIQKIRKIVTKTKGYLEMSIDEGKGQMTVKGAMDMKALAQSLAEKLRRTVDIVPPKKEAEKKEKENESSGDGGKGKSGQNLIQYVEYGYPNPTVFGYGYGYPVEQLHASQMFSDENPNACSVM